MVSPVAELAKVVDNLAQWKVVPVATIRYCQHNLNRILSDNGASTEAAVGHAEVVQELSNGISGMIDYLSMNHGPDERVWSWRHTHNAVGKQVSCRKGAAGAPFAVVALRHDPAQANVVYVH